MLLEVKCTEAVSTGGSTTWDKVSRYQAPPPSRVHGQGAMPESRWVGIAVYAHARPGLGPVPPTHTDQHVLE